MGEASKTSKFLQQTPKNVERADVEPSGLNGNAAVKNNSHSPELDKLFDNSTAANSSHLFKHIANGVELEAMSASSCSTSDGSGYRSFYECIGYCERHRWLHSCWNGRNGKCRCSSHCWSGFQCPR